MTIHWPQNQRVEGGLLREMLDSAMPAMRGLLRQSIEFPSVSGQEAEFTRFIEQWAHDEGFETDLWETDEALLAGYPQVRMKHLPLAGRPTLVIRLPGAARGPSLLFNAHADVVGAGDPARWSHGPWAGTEAAGRIYGRGACDTKGPLISALWAMWAIRQAMPGGLPGDVLLELIPGEEDCVGLGTLTSIARGWRADGAIVLEPTASLPRCASRGGSRFQIVCQGRAVHGTVKWLGADAIGMLREVLEALAVLEERWNRPDADPLFKGYPIARPVTVDAIQGGEWPGMICDRALCAGYLELLPGDPLDEWKKRFAEELRTELGEPADGRLEIGFSEDYPGHRTPPGDPFCRIAGEVAESFASTDESAEMLTGFNSGCEAGIRAGLHGTPTLVWGPGSLAQAHAADEFIIFEEVKRVAAMFGEFLIRWAAEGGIVPHGIHNHSR